MGSINKKTCRPSADYTDLEWQQEFLVMKSNVEPSGEKKMNVQKEVSSDGKTYHGKTQYQYYCSCINDILQNIRSGGTDYCFYTYQISDLLKFEHDRLSVRWLQDDRCFEVTLKNIVKKYR